MIKCIYFLALFILASSCSLFKENNCCKPNESNLLKEAEYKNEKLISKIKFPVNDTLIEIESAIEIINTFKPKFLQAINSQKPANDDWQFTYAYLYTLEPYGPKLAITMQNYLSKYPNLEFNPILALYNFTNDEWLFKYAHLPPVDALISLEYIKLDLLVYLYNAQNFHCN